jgi:uncharacterized protein
MRVAITGASGLIGSALTEALEQDGHEVTRMVRERTRQRPEDGYWNPAEGEVDTDAFAGADAVVHLGAASFGARRWNRQVKQHIRDSRVHGTRLVAEALAGMTSPPPVLLCASAAGYYGDRGDEILTEQAAPGDDFLASLTVDWERAADPARDAGIRVVHARTGAVVAEGSLLIDKIELPFRLGVGGKVGSGRQWVPWISMHDEVAALRFLLEHDLAGSVNLVAPEPVRNAELTRAIGEVLRRPTVMPVPMFALRLVYGEVATTLAGTSQRVVPQQLLDAGFTFTHTDVREPLRIALGR